ncbi:TetR/AcrR family transcriptional regulator [Mycobacteroides salmoniphilum]|uniref:Transcriptional regulator BetI n=1 Tax=Mycobacteroides salmoniphilum TaxID=404941 RepID=A0A4R8SII3_9MYCO|nr:TetR family transcriptional regulator [Mycobacteroides salmoniphilum]TDZ96702.1 transcriptional regulator BetI [Mycobacteroides salmoniphilum]TEA05797.1 transcriptional regulator BetI [Mycobacteroides salmoniphilum]
MADDRRMQLADAGLAVLAAAGARGLTHRAVDRSAGLSEGSTSYYFRTRAALLQACATRLGERTMTVVSPLADAADLSTSELAQLAVSAVRAWVADHGVLVLARHELLLESAHHPEIRSVLVAATDHLRVLLERRVSVLTYSDAAERTADLIACLDGVALAHTVRGVSDEDSLKRSVIRVVAGLLDRRD